MSRTSDGRGYKLLAEYYDRLFDFGASWSERARQKVLGRILPHIESACDLCCGTGITAVRLASQGIRMFGVDLSAGMCRIAREKARRAHLPVRIVHGDMRSFRLPEFEPPYYKLVECSSFKQPFTGDLRFPALVRNPCNPRNPCNLWMGFGSGFAGL